MNLIEKYFPDLSADQYAKFESLIPLYNEWNKKINLISRKDIPHLYERHILHSLAIAKFISFEAGTSVLDVGTGGGFPGIPLAIFFQQVHFHLVDSVGKKIKVVQALSDYLRLSNVQTSLIRAEQLSGEFDFVISRAVAPVKTICNWTKNLITYGDKNEYNNGWIFLKGGDLEPEIAGIGDKVLQIPLSNYFEEEFFKEKFIIYLPHK